MEIAINFPDSVLTVILTLRGGGLKSSPQTNRTVSLYESFSVMYGINEPATNGTEIVMFAMKTLFFNERFAKP